MNVLDDLRWRGLLHTSTDGIAAALAGGPITAYIGFDPTAPSLHVGSLLTVMGLARLQRHGHRPIALVGGGTGLIGDPSGKSQERNLLTLEQTAENAEGIRRQLEHFLDFSPALSNAALLRNNVEWLRPIGFLDFLRDVGKHFTVNYMMAKDSVKRRIEGVDGVSFTEFSYQLLQAYDFLVLHDRDRCMLQLGGTDQWGNITAGCELVRKVRGAQVHGLVWPLLTTASGAKFGKTESGAVWLDAARTSPYEFYQFWLKTDDRDVVQHLKGFTFLERDEIEAIAAAHAAAPERRDAQRTLAQAITRLVHGDGELVRAERASQVHVRRQAVGCRSRGHPHRVRRRAVDRPAARCARRRRTGGRRRGREVGADRLEGGSDPAHQAGRPLCERSAAVGGCQSHRGRRSDWRRGAGAAQGAA